MSITDVTTPKIKVMLVEDDPVVRRMYESGLRKAGFTVIEASDGTFVYETARLQQPDLIVMDIMMPNFNGFDAIQELRNGILIHDVPILVLSAYDDPEFVKKAYALGIAQYLVKSNTEPSKLATIIQETLVAHRQPKV